MIIKYLYTKTVLSFIVKNMVFYFGGRRVCNVDSYFRNQFQAEEACSTLLRVQKHGGNYGCDIRIDLVFVRSKKNVHY